MERLTVFNGEFWEHKNFPPVAEDTVDEFIDCVKELAERLAAIENILGDAYQLDNLKKMVEAFDNHQVLLIPKEGIKWLYRFGPDGIEFAKAPKEKLKSPRETDRPGG